MVVKGLSRHLFAACVPIRVTAARLRIFPALHDDDRKRAEARGYFRLRSSIPARTRSAVEITAITTRPPGLMVVSVGARFEPEPVKASASVSSGSGPMVATTPVAVLIVTSRVWRDCRRWNSPREAGRKARTTSS